MNKKEIKSQVQNHTSLFETPLPQLKKEPVMRNPSPPLPLQPINWGTLPPCQKNNRSTETDCLHIMVIDDDEISNYVLSRRLYASSENITITIATDGKKALERLTDIVLQRGEKFPQLILVDLDMPVLDGFEFIEYYQREFRPFFPDTELFVLTASERVEDKQKVARIKGVSRFVAKPLPLYLIV